jgi:serine protease Do
MTLRRLLLALAVLPLWLGTAAAEDAPPRPAAAPTETAAEPLTRTGARRTAVVAAVERVKRAVVNIHSERAVAQSGGDLYPLPSSPASRVNGMGTGIVIDHRGYIVTNHHVVEDVSLLRIRLADGTTRNAVVVARNPEIDLALIKIDAPEPLPVMPIGTAQDLMVGETVVAVGNAYGYEHTVSVGVVSAIKRDVSLNKDMAYKALIQTDAAINPGNSGGPLVNVQGDLVGVNVAIRAGAQNIGFAITADQMVKTVSEMLRTRRRASTYDGLACRDVLDETPDGLKRKVVVDRVEPNSPAETAGLKAGDVLRQLGGIPIRTGIDVERALLDRKVGDRLTAVVRRETEEKKLDVALAAADRMVRPAGVSDLVWQKLGLQLAPVAADMVTRVNGDLHGGLEVTAVSSSGAAARAGIRKGDILVGLHQFETVSLDNVTYVLNHPDLTAFNPISFYILRSGQVRKGTMNPGQ